jgi:hypothetical protein
MWASAALRFVVYEPDATDPQGRHRVDANKYVYTLELQVGFVLKGTCQTLS